MVVRSASFYTVSNMAHATLMADSDTEDGADHAWEASRLHETVVQEDVHIVHAVDLQQQEAWTMPFQQTQFVSLEIDAHGIISVSALPLLTKGEMIERFPCPPTPPELVPPPPPTEAEQAAIEKANEIVAIKQELLSLIPPLSRLVEDNTSTDDVKQPRTSQRRAAKGLSPSRPTVLSPKASRVASMTFVALLLLYLAFLVFVVTQAVSLWFPGTWSTPTSKPLSASSTCDVSDVCTTAEVDISEGYTPAPPVAYWVHNCSEAQDTMTDRQPSSQPQNCSPDSDGDQSTEAFHVPSEAEKDDNSCQTQQMIFAAASPLARLRYTMRRLRQNVTKTLDYVRYAVVYTITRFPFAFRAS